jgi:hypothetical protein
MTEMTELSGPKPSRGLSRSRRNGSGWSATSTAREDGSDLPAEVLSAFDGVDLIIHLGHMGAREVLGRGVLDRYAEVAPVLGVRDYSTNNNGKPYITPADGDRVAGLTRVIEVGGVRIGAVHNLGGPPGPEITTPPGGLPELGEVPVPDTLAKKFGGPVDVVSRTRSGSIPAARKACVRRSHCASRRR